MPTHILIATDQDYDRVLEFLVNDVEFDPCWVVPKNAEEGDACVLSHRGKGLFAYATLQVEATPDGRTKGRYVAMLTGIEPVLPHVPHAVLKEAFPDWAWATYPRSYTSVEGELEDPVHALLAAVVDYGSDELDDEMLSNEGAVRVRVHLHRERNCVLVDEKKWRVLREKGRLTCECCSFDFEKVYGDLGEGFVEVHHTKPIGLRDGAEITRLEDLVVVCSNCHRMLHRRGLISLDELRTILAKARQACHGHGHGHGHGQSASPRRRHESILQPKRSEPAREVPRFRRVPGKA